MIFKELKNQYKKIIGWGTTGAYEKYGRMYEKYMDYVIDSNPLKWGTGIGALTIYSPEQLLSENSEDCVIIIFSSFVEEIRENIKVKGNFNVIAGSTIDYFCKKRIELYQKQELSLVFLNINWNKVICCVSTMTSIVSVIGGENKFVTDQNLLLKAEGYDILHLVPIQFYHSECEDEKIWITYNEKTLGIYSLNEIVTYIHKIKHMIIHSPCYGVSLIRKLYDAMDLKYCLFYIHDFACVCSEYFLPVEGKDCFEELKRGCTGCKNETKRKKRFQEYEKLFYNNNVLLIAPSKIVADKVSIVYPEAHFEVIPHCVYDIVSVSRQINDKMKIAFVGAATKTKGYEEFKKLVCEFKNSYTFYCFGKCSDKDKIDGVEYVDIYMERSENQLCMLDAFKKYQIDMAYLGSTCCETYSYTYIEAFESGAYVLTTEKSGNICESVKMNQNGYVAKDTDDLICFLKKDALELKDILMKQSKIIVNKSNNLRFLDYM
ncbi:MAG: glycosyltransferase [Lachnospiraceae bacterium]|nr:glycosyltransferase [Lachnospiraceae bacterium]